MKSLKHQYIIAQIRFKELSYSCNRVVFYFIDLPNRNINTRKYLEISKTFSRKSIQTNTSTDTIHTNTFNKIYIKTVRKEQVYKISCANVVQ